MKDEQGVILAYYTFGIAYCLVVVVLFFITLVNLIKHEKQRQKG